MASVRMLLVDDDEAVSSTLANLLRLNKFDVTVAENVSQALKLIVSERFDVLLTDLHMPGPGDGLTVASAMRHVQPEVPTLLLSAFPAMDAAARAVLQQADEILVKPIAISALVDVIRESLKGQPRQARKLESVADILERFAGAIREAWVEQVELDPALLAVKMSYEERSGHLPELFRGLTRRLRSQKEPDSGTLSADAAEYGAGRKRRGYDSAMLVEEARKLQCCVFGVLQKNMKHVDFSLVPGDLITIADELGLQLSQAMRGFNQQTRGFLRRRTAALI